ncbi:MAG: DNA repair protein RecO [Deltaproteobacteria bacterium]|nr:DNA repair protein RecO [Deltaproteobacteria bacterium]MCL5276369.1 DNA repair protein RecO [Deltaproteobacteria bacterium]
MDIFTSEGMVINRLRYLESDLIVTILSKDHGKIKAIAKGGASSRKRFPGAFETGNIGEFGFVEKSPYQLAHLAHAKIDNYLIRLKKDYEKTLMLIYLSGLTDVMTPEHQSSQVLFSTLSDAVLFLEDNKRLDQVRLFYELQLLRINGLLHVVGSCELCKAPFGGGHDVNLIAGTGRFICDSCIPGEGEVCRIPLSLLTIIKSTAKHNTCLGDFSEIEVPSALFGFTRRIISSYIDKPLKLWDMIDNL